MIAKPKNFVADIGHIGGEIDGVWAIAGIGLEKFVPEHDAVLVAEIVKILARALADPVADHIEIGELMHPDLRLEALTGNSLDGLVHAPIASPAEDGNAVDGEREVPGAWDGVGRSFRMPNVTSRLSEIRPDPSPSRKLINRR